jgi:hypothetical protein
LTKQIFLVFSLSARSHRRLKSESAGQVRGLHCPMLFRDALALLGRHFLAVRPEKTARVTTNIAN